MSTSKSAPTTKTCAASTLTTRPTTSSKWTTSSTRRPTTSQPTTFASSQCCSRRTSTGKSSCTGMCPFCTWSSWRWSCIRVLRHTTTTSTSDRDRSSTQTMAGTTPAMPPSTSKGRHSSWTSTQETSSRSRERPSW